uniref:Uncharacterized protein n=1 Tax=Arundo donax TaxID=35708 RepID=A0A0A9FZ02_ARUDO
MYSYLTKLNTHNLITFFLL